MEVKFNLHLTYHRSVPCNMAPITTHSRNSEERHPSHTPAAKLECTCRLLGHLGYGCGVGVLAWGVRFGDSLSIYIYIYIYIYIEHILIYIILKLYYNII